jgi:hypothetical protein
MKQEDLIGINGLTDPRYKISYTPIMNNMLSSLSEKFDTEFKASLLHIKEKYIMDGKLTQTNSNI